MFRRILALCGAIAILCLPANAQSPAGFVTIIQNKLLDGSQLRLPDGSSPVANNITVCAQAVSGGNPISVLVGSPSGGITTVRTVCVNVNNGSWGMYLPDGSLSSPRNPTYKFTAIDNVSGENLLAGYDHVQPTSAVGTPGGWCDSGTCIFDYLPPDAPPQALFVQGPKGDKGDTGQAGCISGTSGCVDAVRKSGDTMTGALILSGNPITDMQAVTKWYIDNLTFGNGKWLHWTDHDGNGRNIAVLNDANDFILQSPWDIWLSPPHDLHLNSGSAIRAYKPLYLAADPITSLEATTKQYVDNRFPTGSGCAAAVLDASGNLKRGATVSCP